MSKQEKRQLKKTERLATLADRGATNNELEIVDTLEGVINDMGDEISSEIGALSDNLDQALTDLNETLKKKSEEEYTFDISEEDRKKLKGDKGDNYILTENDKKEIASKIKVPIVEKITEKTTVVEKIPVVTNQIIEIAKHQTATEIRDSLEMLEGDERLDYTAIKGLEDALKKGGAKEIKLIGGPNGIFLYVDGAKQGIMKTFNLKAGSGISLSVSKVNGMPTITVSATAGAGFETPVGLINSSNITFTVTNDPRAVILNGMWYFENDGYTYDTGTNTITMLVVPVTGSTFKSVF